MTVKLDRKEIERLLALEEYKPIERLDKSTLDADEKAQVREVEQVVSFGQEIIELFDWFIEAHGTLPTQKQYVNSGVNKMLAWFSDNKPDVEVTTVMVEACKGRLTRTYMSKVIELHFEACLREFLPHLNIISHPLIDSVMGVDIVAEDDKKRYYIHITSNTPMARRMLKEKESRGGYRVGSAFIKYTRDFTGDLMLMYDIHAESETTQIINGFPLFRPEFIEWRLDIASRSITAGEFLTAPYSKLKHFLHWAEHQVKLDIQLQEGA
ncbi:hypothetical protein [Bacillus atrophaeus]|uniref:hypothetical protein n=1 Tax=Bacillus atrophaeus TaxID=1452 RepID=UPI00123B6634|nr:hypothetical protein [Bacillus atrophaeus]KAA6454967.1 hypothetical protein DX926_02690 [Bacillus atrophaeus]MED4819132.1 hypothetical protein [Bacillus atrophaeus]MED4827706.1 hypothetical protein [Bacillus atrophaeus]